MTSRKVATAWRRVMLLGAVLASVAACAASQPAQQPAVAPTGRVLFIGPAARGGRENVALATIGLDGSGLKRLITGHVGRPRWSPDGTKIMVNGDPARPIVLDRDGGHRRVLIDSHSRLPLNCSAWSPDGTTLACTGHTGMFTIRAGDGTGLRRITSPSNASDHPGDFSPDGKRLVFQRNEEQMVMSALFVVGVDGKGLKQITGWGYLEDLGSWSPDGRWILYSKGRTFWLVHPDGSGRRSIVIDKSTCEFVTSPRWSPDGRFIIFLGYTSLAKNSIYTMRTDGSDIRRIPNTETSDSPDWTQK